MPANQVSVHWQGDMRFEAHSHPDRVIALDSARKFGGQGAGARPTELLLVALAGCTAMDVLAILQKKRQKISGLEVQVSGVQAEEYPQVYTGITVSYIVRGTDVSHKAVERAIELSETKYCPVWAMLAASAVITSRFEIHQLETQE